MCPTSCGETLPTGPTSEENGWRSVRHDENPTGVGRIRLGLKRSRGEASTSATGSYNDPISLVTPARSRCSSGREIINLDTAESSRTPASRSDSATQAFDMTKRRRNSHEVAADSGSTASTAARQRRSTAGAGAAAAAVVPLAAVRRTVSVVPPAAERRMPPAAQRRRHAAAAVVPPAAERTESPASERRTPATERRTATASASETRSAVPPVAERRYGRRSAAAAARGLRCIGMLSRVAAITRPSADGLAAAITRPTAEFRDYMLARQLQQEEEAAVASHQLAMRLQQNENELRFRRRAEWWNSRVMSAMLQEVDRDFNANDYDMLLSLDDDVKKQTGASPSAIAQLPLSQVIAYEATVDCAICLELPAVGDTIRRLPCFHCFHQKCIDTWLKSSALCPICKADISMSSVES